MLEVIQKYQEKHGRLPTVSELARLEGVTRATIYERLEKLIDAGIIRKKDVEYNAGYELV